jgi:hypothetical protein
MMINFRELGKVQLGNWEIAISIPIVIGTKIQNLNVEGRYFPTRSS